MMGEVPLGCHLLTADRVARGRDGSHACGTLLAILMTWETWSDMVAYSLTESPLTADDEERQAAVTRLGQRRLTLAELCWAIETGALPAEQTGESYAVRRRDLGSLIVRRTVRRIGSAWKVS
jgi:hypothetical protein